MSNKNSDPTGFSGEDAVNVPNEISTNVAINSAYETVLWDESGAHSVSVGQEDIEYWLRRGFRRNKLDVSTNVSELFTLFDEAKRAIAEYVDGCTRDGVIDPGDQAAGYVATQTMSMIATRYIQLMADIAVLYPIKATGNVVTLYKTNGNVVEEITIEDSPNQVDIYTNTYGYSATKPEVVE